MDEPFLAEDNLPDDSFMPEKPAAPVVPQAADQEAMPDNALPQRPSAIDKPQSFAPVHPFKGSPIFWNVTVSFGDIISTKLASPRSSSLQPAIMKTTCTNANLGPLARVV